ncbi:hypothetical protein [Propionivibrio soli]|nr:hypothetical protein [Propionivibrio soli]
MSDSLSEVFAHSMKKHPIKFVVGLLINLGGILALLAMWYGVAP